jgi:hypothetical protein
LVADPLWLRKLNGKKIGMMPSSVNTKNSQINGIFIREGRKLIALIDVRGRDAVFDLQGLGQEKWLHLPQTMFI